MRRQSSGRPISAAALSAFYREAIILFRPLRRELRHRLQLQAGRSAPGRLMPPRAFNERSRERRTAARRRQETSTIAERYWDEWWRIGSISSYAYLMPEKWRRWPPFIRNAGGIIFSIILRPSPSRDSQISLHHRPRIDNAPRARSIFDIKSAWTTPQRHICRRCRFHERLS